MQDRVLIWRRHLLASLASAALPLSALPVRAQPGAAARPPATLSQWQHLSPAEGDLLTAMMRHLIPSDDLGPGAVECGGVTFIDRQFGTPWATGDHFYAKGPFAQDTPVQATPTQGYQLHLPPLGLLREGLARFDAVVAQQAGGGFASLPPERQVALLQDLEAGRLDLSPFPGPVVFQTLLDVTIESFFADPLYGGNRDMAGWKLVGFPGYYASYVAEIERHNMPFRRPPQSLADLARAHAADAEHGLPPHGADQGAAHGGHSHPEPAAALGGARP